MKKAFTLVELLVVIAVIGILSAIITPNLLNARNSARIAAGQRFDSSVYHSIGDYLVGEWMFDIPTNTLLDTSGMGNNGSTTTSPTYYQTGGYNSKGAFSFDGTDDFIDAGSGSSLNITGSITMSAWIKPASPAQTGYVVCKNLSDSGDTTYAFYFNSANNSITFILNAGAETAYSPANSVSLDQWNHITVTYDQSYMKVYVNGNLSGTPTVYSSTVNSTAGSVNLGRRKTGAFFKGYIDDVRIYATALSSSEIEKLYAEGKSSHQTYSCFFPQI